MQSISRHAPRRRAAGFRAGLLGVCLAAALAAALGGAARVRAGSDGVVNVNTASVDELVRLPGIGESKAQAIVDFRKERGAFKSVDAAPRGEGHRRCGPRAHPPPRRDRREDDAQLAAASGAGGGAPPPAPSLLAPSARPRAGLRRSGTPLACGSLRAAFGGLRLTLLPGALGRAGRGLRRQGLRSPAARCAGLAIPPAMARGRSASFWRAARGGGRRGAAPPDRVAESLADGDPRRARRAGRAGGRRQLLGASSSPRSPALPVVGGLYNPSLEAVVALEPDLVVLVPSAEQRDFRAASRSSGSAPRPSTR